MYRLGAFTDEISQDLERACKVCCEFGVEGVEVRGVWDTPVQKLTDGQVRDIERIAGDHGLIVCSIGSPFGKCELDQPGQVAAHMDVLRRCADIGLELGCRVVRGLAFWGHGAREKPWDKMAKAYEPVAFKVPEGFDDAHRSTSTNVQSAAANERQPSKNRTSTRSPSIPITIPVMPSGHVTKSPRLTVHPRSDVRGSRPRSHARRPSAAPGTR
jgi:hypothetical protein